MSIWVCVCVCMYCILLIITSTLTKISGPVFCETIMMVLQWFKVKHPYRKETRWRGQGSPKGEAEWEELMDPVGRGLY